jgi:hypothetical protein
MIMETAITSGTSETSTRLHGATTQNAAIFKNVSSQDGFQDEIQTNT